MCIYRYLYYKYIFDEFVNYKWIFYIIWFIFDVGNSWFLWNIYMKWMLYFDYLNILVWK